MKPTSDIFSAESFATLIRRTMRQNKITVSALARFAGVTQDRVRELRNTGRAEWQEEWVLTLRDFVRAKGGA